jgi:hypothetical protein
MKKAISILALVLTLGLLSWADDITPDQLDDPATLHTGTGSSTACATGGCYVFGNEVNGINGNTVDIYQQSNGAGTLHSPWLLILGVANSTNANLFSTSSIKNVTSINTYPGGVTTLGSAVYGNNGVPLYGWNGNGYAGSMTSSDVYSFLALQGNGIDKSNSFGNWAAADLAVNSITVQNFGIYVFAITAPLSGNGLTNITFDVGALPKGTFVVGYGYDNTHVYVNPFTEAGLELHSTTVVTPEPASLALLGSGLLGLGGFVRKKFRK